jgi:hypothetical protein
MGCAAAWFLSAADARAEIREAAERLAKSWRLAGARVVVDVPRFLHNRGDGHSAVTAALPKTQAGECTTVALLGARGFAFHVRLPASSHADASSGRDGRDPRLLPSMAGALSMEWCGEAPEERFAVVSDGGRGALEVVVASSRVPLPSLITVLPERASMPPTQPLGPASRLVLPSASARVAHVQSRARLDGGGTSSYARWLANSRGGGGGDFVLDPGCHMLALVAADSTRGSGDDPGHLDLDAEMRSGQDGTLLARDRSDAPDARLEQCVGEATPVTVTYVGARPGHRVIVAHTSWRLPQHLPTLWGPIAMGRIAQDLRAHHVTELPFDPVWLAQGAPGTTTVTIPVEAGGCYLAMAPEVSGIARSIGLSVRTSEEVTFDDRGHADTGPLVAFCTGGRTMARIEVTARGSRSLMWGLVVYRVSSDIWRGSR